MAPLVKHTVLLPILTEINIKRFWRPVRKSNGCWIRGGQPDAYSLVNIKGGPMAAIAAHRFSFLLHHKTELGDAMVCHLCHTKGCVRPSHLELGNNAKNVKQSIEVGKHRRKIERDGILDKLFADYMNGLTVCDLAEKYAIDSEKVYKIVTGSYFLTRITELLAKRTDHDLFFSLTVRTIRTKFKL